MVHHLSLGNVGYRLDRVLLKEDDCHAALSKRFGGFQKIGISLML
jgi:hypothetical protein